MSSLSVLLSVGFSMRCLLPTSRCVLPHLFTLALLRRFIFCTILGLPPPAINWHCVFVELNSLINCCDSRYLAMRNYPLFDYFQNNFLIFLLIFSAITGRHSLSIFINQLFAKCFEILINIFEVGILDFVTTYFF